MHRFDPNSVTSIGDSAFYGCTSLAEISIPESVTSIGTEAFTETPWAEAAMAENGLLIINNILVKSTNSSESITIPDNVTGINNRVFYNSQNLKQISIPDSVSRIGDNAFENCSSLTNMNIPSSLTSIQYAVFAGCDSLTSVNIPDSVTSIDSYAFYGAGLTSITIPASVTEIGAYALGYQAGYDRIPVDGFTIYGYPGSAAETYANDNSFTFVALNDAGLAIVADRTDEVYIRYSGTGATIYCTGDFDKFVNVEMDGVVVDPSNYTVVEGSTVLTFASSYLDTLATGQHTVTLNYIDGSISTTLTILDKEDAGAAANGSGSSSTASSVANRAAKTGVQMNIALWLMLGAASVIIFAAVLVRRKKSA